MGKHKENLITEEQRRPIYEIRYECPKCQYPFLEVFYFYCPNCGAKLTWRLEEK